ncbi:MAG: hypothetical protein Tsb002_11920 [Wenzhouxiangellaceae bacterium]
MIKKLAIYLLISIPMFTTLHADDTPITLKGIKGESVLTFDIDGEPMLRIRNEQLLEGNENITVVGYWPETKLVLIRLDNGNNYFIQKSKAIPNDEKAWQSMTLIKPSRNITICFLNAQTPPKPSSEKIETMGNRGLGTNPCP